MTLNVLIKGQGEPSPGIEQIAKDMVQETRVKLDEWGDIKDELLTLNREIIESVNNKKKVYLEFIAEIDEKRGSVEEAINKGAA